jgi:hypothetical protein
MSQSYENHEPTYRTPRWVKVLGIIALISVLLLGILLLTGEHGPGRHEISSDNLTPSTTDQAEHQP